MFKWIRGTHAVPVFAGTKSKSHQRLPLRQLKARAIRLSLGDRRLSDIECFVQFAGFPRSGHSIVGSILDAHEHCIVSHELDAMGLVDADFRLREIAALATENSSLFTENHRYWNGFCYKVEGGLHGKATQPRVFGDKKGDWATRRCRENPRLLSKLRRRAGKTAVKWILVTRNPFDNIATMSLRKDPSYDHRRIEATSEGAPPTGLEHPGGVGARIAARADMVDDYSRLCEGVAMMKRKAFQNEWLEIRHEALINNPRETIREMIGFLDLNDSGSFSDRSARLISRRAHRSRFDVEWTSELSSRVFDLIEKHDFLRGYDFES
jgi:hypothetical protein